MMPGSIDSETRAAQPVQQPNRDALAELIWHTSRADESTISATGANIIADALMAAGFRKPEAAPSDTDRETLIVEARRWNDFIGNPLARNRMTNGECSIAVKTIEKVLTAFEEVLARTSQPVQVEVTTGKVAPDVDA